MVVSSIPMWNPRSNGTWAAASGWAAASFQTIIEGSNLSASLDCNLGASRGLWLGTGQDRHGTYWVLISHFTHATEVPILPWLLMTEIKNTCKPKPKHNWEIEWINVLQVTKRISWLGTITAVLARASYSITENVLAKKSMLAIEVFPRRVDEVSGFSATLKNVLQGPVQAWWN